MGQVCIGGYARTITAVRKLLREKADKNPIYLNIGDNFQGTLWYQLLGWNVTSHFLNLLSADATVCITLLVFTFQISNTLSILFYFLSDFRKS